MSPDQTGQLPGFGQSDPTDNRKLLDWKTKYQDPDAQREIRFEARYLAGLLGACPVLLVLLWLRIPESAQWISSEIYRPVLKFGSAWVAGTLGGTLFDIKWLYHSIARQRWHLDRRWWRLFTPHVSGALAFAAVAIISSDILRILDKTATNRMSTVVGIAFLVGYFSDSSIAKLSEIAETLFGTSRSKEKHLTSPQASVEEEASPKVP